MGLEYQMTQQKLCKEMGYDYSSECFIKGERKIIILIDIGGYGEINGQPVDPKKDENFKLFIFFEMSEALKVEMFDCDQYVITIDDLVVQLTEALKYDIEMEN